MFALVHKDLNHGQVNFFFFLTNLCFVYTHTQKMFIKDQVEVVQIFKYYTKQQKTFIIVCL